MRALWESALAALLRVASACAVVKFASLLIRASFSRDKSWRSLSKSVCSSSFASFAFVFSPFALFSEFLAFWSSSFNAANSLAGTTSSTKLTLLSSALTTPLSLSSTPGADWRPRDWYWYVARGQAHSQIHVASRTRSRKQ